MYEQWEKNLLSSNISSRCPHNMVNFGILAAEIDPVVWGTPANFNGFRVLTVLLHGSQVVSISQTLRRWTQGTTYVRQGDHQPTIGPHSSLQYDSALASLVGRQEMHPACKNCVVRCWRVYLSRARCKWFACGPADATATPHHLLLQ